MNRLTARLDALMRAATQPFVTAWNGCKAALKAIVAAIVTAFTVLGDTVMTIVRGIVRGITSAITGMANALSTVIRGIGKSINAFFSAIGRGIGRTVSAVFGAVKNVDHAFVDLFRQIGGDIMHLIKGAKSATATLLRRIGHRLLSVLMLLTLPFRKALRPLTLRLRRSAAKEARDQAQGISVTSDHGSHREMLMLLGFVGLLLAAGLWYVSSLGLVGGPSVSVPTITPERVFAKLATFSPLALTALAGIGVAVLFAAWFWLTMLRDSYRRDYASQTEKTKWRLVTTLFFIPGAMYYFVKVYNHWSMRQFLSYHVFSVMITGVAVLVTTSTGGVLYYFNAKANAQVAPAKAAKLPQLQLDDKTKEQLLKRTPYGPPLVKNEAGGRIDPFAPIPGQAVTTSPSPRPAVSPSPSAASAAVTPLP